jgi:hypothetical protein
MGVNKMDRKNMSISNIGFDYFFQKAWDEAQCKSTGLHLEDKEEVNDYLKELFRIREVISTCENLGAIRPEDIEWYWMTFRMELINPIIKSLSKVLGDDNYNNLIQVLAIETNNVKYRQFLMVLVKEKVG